jgi:hypothetical protein
MKDGIYSLLKAKFLISDDALKNWKFIVFLVVLGMLMLLQIITNTMQKITESPN